MHSTIYRKYQLNRLLTQYGAHELYAKECFSFEDESPELVALIRDNRSSVNLLMEMSEIFNSVSNVYITINPHGLCLEGLKIVWRDGTWYV